MIVSFISSSEEKRGARNSSQHLMWLKCVSEVKKIFWLIANYLSYRKEKTCDAEVKAELVADNPWSNRGFNPRIWLGITGAQNFLRHSRLTLHAH
jgi:hypothetical protein